MTAQLENLDLAPLVEPRWPECQWRGLVEDPQLVEEFSLCRHSRVRTPKQLVSPAVCQSCTMRLTESPPPPIRSERSGCCGGGPSLLQKGWNAVLAVAQFLADGAVTLTAEQYRARLDICESCDQRRVNMCTACGCHLTLKARGRAFQCPLGKWPVLSDTG